MTIEVPLLSGAYQTRGFIAGAQRCVNLYTEINAAQAAPAGTVSAQTLGPSTTTHYPTPGLTTLVQGPKAPWRCLYTATNGKLFGVINNMVYFITPAFILQQLGVITVGSAPISMKDNGVTLVIVDGSTNGYTVALSTLAFGTIVDPTGTFVGADRVDIIDGFFVFNSPGLPIWYASLNNELVLNALYFASKSNADPLVSIIVMHNEIWLLGTQTSEIWSDVGAANFPFARVAGAFIEHGCAAKYSVCKQDTNVFWLSQDMQGRGIVVMGSDYTAIRISTHAIEESICQYPTISDAIGFVYQYDGHIFYVLTFPSGDATWVYDRTTQLWHELVWSDSNGTEHRHRANCFAFAYNTLICGDWLNGKLYKIDANAYTDDTAPIIRIRSFPHQLNNMNRAFYTEFVANMECGTEGGLIEGDVAEPQVSLRWSDTRGQSFLSPIHQTLGVGGQYYTMVQFQRLGMARDRVFELSWSAPCFTALNGAFIDIIPVET